MCWISQNAIANIANEDIESFKIVLLSKNNTIHSYYREFEYELNKLYKTELEIVKNRGFCYGYNALLTNYTAIFQGFHSYTNDVKYRIVYYDMIKMIGVINNKTNDVIQSYIIDSSLYDKKILVKSVIANCIIPKGSTYYVNHKEEIVSNQLIIKSIKEL